MHTCIYVCVYTVCVPYIDTPDMYVRCWLNVTVVMEEISRGTSHQYERERDEYEWNGFPVWLSPNQFYICIRICRTRGVSNKGSLIFSSFSVALHSTHPRDVSLGGSTHQRSAKKRMSSNRSWVPRTPKYVTINCVSVRARAFVRTSWNAPLPIHYWTRIGTRNTFKYIISMWSFIKIPMWHLQSIFSFRWSVNTR